MSKHENSIWSSFGYLKATWSSNWFMSVNQFNGNSYESGLTGGGGQESSQYERKSGTGEVTLSLLERGRERGRKGDGWTPLSRSLQGNWDTSLLQRELRGFFPFRRSKRDFLDDLKAEKLLGTAHSTVLLFLVFVKVSLHRNVRPRRS